MTIDKECLLLKSFLDDLREGYRYIEELNEVDRFFFIGRAKSYYKYLASYDIKYGKLALEVIEMNAGYGRYANIHLVSQSLFEGISQAQMEEVRERIIIRLAYRDAQMRAEFTKQTALEELESIKAYHIDEFKKHTTPYAWSGLIFDEIVGKGTWIELYDKDLSFIEGMLAITRIKALDVKVEQYSYERMLQAATHVFKFLSSRIDIEFSPTITAPSKEAAASIFRIDICRVEEIQDDRSKKYRREVDGKLFSIKPAEEFLPDEHEANIEEELTSSAFAGIQSFLGEDVNKDFIAPSLMGMNPSDLLFQDTAES
jgi:hypothetical protein